MWVTRGDAYACTPWAIRMIGIMQIQAPRRILAWLNMSRLGVPAIRKEIEVDAMHGHAARRSTYDAH